MHRPPAGSDGKLLRAVVHWADAAAVTCAKLGRRGGSAQALLTATVKENAVQAWAVTRGEARPVALLLGLSQRAGAVTFDTREEQALAGSDSGSIKVWSIRKEQVLTSIGSAHRTGVTALEGDPNSSELFASGSMDTTVRYWDQRDARQPVQVLKGVHQEGISALAMSPDGKMLLSGDEGGQLKFIELRKWRCLPLCPQQPEGVDRMSGPVSCARFHPLEFAAFAGSGRGTMIGLEFEQQLQRQFSVAVSPAARPVWALEAVPLSTGADCVVSSDMDALRVWRGGSMVYEEAATWQGMVMDSALVESGDSPQILQLAADTFHLTLWALDTAAIGRLQRHHALAPAAAPPAGGSPNDLAAVGMPASPDGAALAHAQAFGGGARANGAPGRPRRGSESAPAAAAAAGPALPSGYGGPCFPSPAVRSAQQHSELARRASQPGTLIRHDDESPAPLGIDFSSWLAHRRGRSDGEKVVRDAAQQGAGMSSLLQARLQTMRAVRSLWDRGDRTAALAHCAKAAEAEYGVGVDILGLLTSSQRARESLTQEHCGLLLRTVAVVLRNPKATDGACSVAIHAAHSLARRFYAQAERIVAAAPPRGVDIAGEARREKAQECLMCFAAVREALPQLRGCTPQVREEAALLARDISAAGAVR